MYAIVQVGGRQYRAAAGERLVVDRMDVEAGTRVQLGDVRMLVAEEGDDTQTEVGHPQVADVAVAARAVSHFRGPKILVFKYKPKKRYRRHLGFRAELTELRIEEVHRGAYQAEPTGAATRRPTPARAARAKAAAAKEDSTSSEPLTGETPRIAKPKRGGTGPEATVGSGSAAKAATPVRRATAAPRAAKVPQPRAKAARPRAKAADKKEPADGA